MLEKIHVDRTFDSKPPSYSDTALVTTSPVLIYFQLYSLKT